jgi:nucleoid DNA-binding protein
MKVDVTSCIVDLLHGGYDVSLPGIGTFSVDNKGAEIIGNRVHPPKSYIQFSDKEAVHKELADLIRNRYKITKDTANNVIKKYSQILIGKLVNFNSVKIPNLGALSSSNGGKIKFIDGKNLVNAGNELLPSFELKELIDTKTSTVKPIAAAATATTAAASSVIGSTINSTKGAASSVISGVKPAEPKPATSFATPTKKTTPIYPPTIDETTSWTSYLLPIFLLLLLLSLLFFGLKKCTSLINGSNGSDADTTELVGDSDGSESEDDLDYTGGEDSFVQYTLADIDDIPADVYADGCIIIVGSFTQNRNAIRMVTRLKSMGYSTYQELNDDGLNRVGIEINCSPEEFESILQKIRNEVEPYSWYLVPLLEIDY